MGGEPGRMVALWVAITSWVLLPTASAGTSILFPILSSRVVGSVCVCVGGGGGRDVDLCGWMKG